MPDIGGDGVSHLVGGPLHLARIGTARAHMLVLDIRPIHLALLIHAVTEQKRSWPEFANLDRGYKSVQSSVGVQGRDAWRHSANHY